MKIKGILIDSGKVLNGPSMGHWFITPNFFKYVDQNIYQSISRERKRMAFSEAAKYMKKQNLIETVEEEFEHFMEYYKRFFSVLAELNMNEEDIGLVAKDLVFNADKYLFYEEVYDLLPRLSQRYKLAVVSDAWPSLEEVFMKPGLREYFSSFIISSKLGVVKPHKSMYETALDELNIRPEEAIFIDDNIKNCDGAKKLGIKSFLLCRDIKHFLFYKLTCRAHRVVRNLSSVEKYLKKLES